MTEIGEKTNHLPFPLQFVLVACVTAFTFLTLPYDNIQKKPTISPRDFVTNVSKGQPVHNDKVSVQSHLQNHTIPNTRLFLVKQMSTPCA